MGEARAKTRRPPAPPRAFRDPAVRRALDADILGLNLEPVSFLIACEQPWTLEKIDALEFEYRCFLQLARDRPDLFSAACNGWIIQPGVFPR